MLNGNIRAIEKMEDGSRIIHTTYGLEKALHRTLTKAIGEIAKQNTQVLLECYQAGESCFADMAASLVKMKFMTSDYKNLKGMDFILTGQGHKPIIDFATYVPNEEKAQAAEWLIQALQNAEVVEMLGEKIVTFTCVFGDVAVQVGVGDTAFDIQRSWCAVTTPCSSR